MICFASTGSHLIPQGRELASPRVDEPIADLLDVSLIQRNAVLIDLKYLADCEIRAGHEHLLVLFTGIRMVQVLVKPLLEDLSGGLREVPTPALVLRVDGVAENAKIRLRPMR